MSLADHWSDGNYFTEGEYEVEVSDYRVFTYNTGNPGVEFKLRSDDGKEIKLGLSLKDTALWKLALFARDCGMTKEQCRNYNTDNENSHRVLLGKRVCITVLKQDKYHEVDSWRAVDPGKPAHGKLTPVQRPESRPQQARGDDNYSPPMSGGEVPF